MVYDYKVERDGIFTESGLKLFLKIRDRTTALLKAAGVVRSKEIITGMSGDSWMMMACIDYMIELGELHELTMRGAVPGQYRIFTKN